MKIVILGYTGLIGNNILKNLAKNTSLDLLCISRNIKNRHYKNSKIKYLSWDFTTFKKKNLLFLNKADIIINCVGKTENNSYDLENINVIFVRKLLKYINLYRPNIRLIHLSSIAV